MLSLVKSVTGRLLAKGGVADSDKHVSLLRFFISYERKTFYGIGLRSH